MYWLLNKIFGWDYIAWENSCDSGVARVRKDFNGKTWYYRYYVTKCTDIIKTADQVIWITCKPSKYL